MLKRIVRRNTVVVVRAPQAAHDPAPPDGLRFARISAQASPADHDLIEAAMHAGGEPPGLVAPRLAHGDEFFGWLADGHVCSFVWATYRDRTVGGVRFAEADGRVFLYNAHTLEKFGGRGLYPALLMTIRSVLGREHTTELVGEVSIRNSRSRRGIERAGFIAVAQITFLTLFDRWNWPLTTSVMNDSASLLFHPQTSAEC